MMNCAVSDDIQLCLQCAISFVMRKKNSKATKSNNKRQRALTSYFSSVKATAQSSSSKSAEKQKSTDKSDVDNADRIIDDSTSQRCQLTLEEAEKELRRFDLNADYGPCVGMTRQERWDRAQKLGKQPPELVIQILSDYPSLCNHLWHKESFCSF